MAGRQRTTDEQKRLLAVLGADVRALRERAGYTQVEAGHVIGTDDKYISRIERGLVNVTATRLVELAHAYGVPPGALLDGTALAYAEARPSSST